MQKVCFLDLEGAHIRYPSCLAEMMTEQSQKVPAATKAFSRVSSKSTLSVYALDTPLSRCQASASSMALCMRMEAMG